MSGTRPPRSTGSRRRPAKRRSGNPQLGLPLVASIEPKPPAKTGPKRTRLKKPAAPSHPSAPTHQVKHPVARRRAARAATLARLAAAKRRLAQERRSLALASLGVLLLLGSCAAPRLGETPRHSLALVATDYQALPGWNADHVAEAMPALRNTCAVIAQWPDEKPLGVSIGGQAADWRPACAAAAAVPAGDDAATAAFLAAYFQPYRAIDSAAESGLFTGYYETEVDGSRVKTAEFTAPLYRAPATPVGYSRAEIDAGALKNRGLELLWLKDPVDVFILQIQGSGLVKLPDGTLTRVGYAGNNGWDFVPVARQMIQAGIIKKDQASMQAVRDWLKANPAEARSWMQKNPRYIFFRELDASKGLPAGPAGALGVTLTPTRSMAVDPAFLPLGVPVWLDTRGPDGAPLQRLMVAQDVGSAIKGPIRGDLFWGTGEPALEFAGRMKSRGQYYVLLPKTLAARSTLVVGDLNSGGSN